MGVAVLAHTVGLRYEAFRRRSHLGGSITARVRCWASGRAPEPRARWGSGSSSPFGFFFSLGHSTVVVASGAGIVVAEKTVFGAVSDSGSGLERFGGLIGTVCSAAFLLLIGLLNLVVLAGLVRVFAQVATASTTRRCWRPASWPAAGL